MKRIIVLMALVMVMPCLAFAAEKKEATKGLKTEKDKTSYSLGFDIGQNLKNLKNQGVEIDPDVLSRGLKDSYTGKKGPMTEQEVRENLGAFQRNLMSKRAEQMRESAEKNKKEGEAFLTENKKKEGVVTLPSGLQYKILTDGTGKIPAKDDKVKVHYKGTLINGTEFDSSYRRNAPAEFGVTGVIPGWTEALQLMKEGSKWQVFIPSNLAYGERGAGPTIGPNQTLLFEIELISIIK